MKKRICRQRNRKTGKLQKTNTKNTKTECYTVSGQRGVGDYRPGKRSKEAVLKRKATKRRQKYAGRGKSLGGRSGRPGYPGYPGYFSGLTKKEAAREAILHNLHSGRGDWWISELFEYVEEYLDGNVSRSTMSAALRQLKDEGFVKTRGRQVWAAK